MGNGPLGLEVRHVHRACLEAFTYKIFFSFVLTFSIYVNLGFIAISVFIF